MAAPTVAAGPAGHEGAGRRKRRGEQEDIEVPRGPAELLWLQELAKFEMDCRNIVINQVIFPEEGGPVPVAVTRVACTSLVCSVSDLGCCA